MKIFNKFKLLRMYINFRNLPTITNRIYLEFRIFPKRILSQIYGFDSWHINSYRDRNYAKYIVALLNSREIRGSALEIGCGLGDITRRLNFRNVQGFDKDKNVLKAAKFISILNILKRNWVSYTRFDVLTNQLEGKYDVILLVNWIHNIESKHLKLLIQTFYSKNLNLGGDLVIDVVNNSGYRYNHSFVELGDGLGAAITVSDVFDYGRRVISFRKI